MRNENPAPLALAVALAFSLAAGNVAASSASDDKTFKKNYETAVGNLLTEGGRAYDRRLGAALQSNKASTDAVGLCLRTHKGPHDLHGYFHFRSPTRYELVIEPRTPFADCLAEAIEGHAVPPPPRLPYFNHFSLQTGDDAPPGGQDGKARKPGIGILAPAKKPAS
jgi:hypothetical protein